MKTVVVLFSIFLGTSAYSFDDVTYNQLLIKDFESLADGDEITAYHPRTRRDAVAPPCPKRPASLCCGAEQVEASQKDTREVRKQCFKEVTGHETFHATPFDPFSCKDIEDRKRDLTCVDKCVAQRQNIADDKGNLIEVELKKYTIENNKLDWLTPTLGDVIAKCIAEAKEATSKQTDKSNKACNPAAIKFNHCMFREMQLGCPDNKIENPRTCAIVRQFAQHSSLFLPHVIPH